MKISNIPSGLYVRTILAHIAITFHIFRVFGYEVHFHPRFSGTRNLFMRSYITFYIGSLIIASVRCKTPFMQNKVLYQTLRIQENITAGCQEYRVKFFVTISVTAHLVQVQKPTFIEETTKPLKFSFQKSKQASQFRQPPSDNNNLQFSPVPTRRLPS